MARWVGLSFYLERLATIYMGAALPAKPFLVGPVLPRHSCCSCTAWGVLSINNHSEISMLLCVIFVTTKNRLQHGSTPSRGGQTFYKYALKLNALEPDSNSWIIIFETLELHHDQKIPTSFHKSPMQMRLAIVLTSLLAAGVMSIPLFKRQDVIEELQNPSIEYRMNLSSNIQSRR